MFRRAPWVFGGLLVLSGLVGTASELNQPWIRGVFTGRSPRPVVAQETAAWQHAGELAAKTRGAFVLVGSGQSMQPLYAPGTIMVLQACAYPQLQSGQTVLYRNKSGKIVAHVLIAKARDGWRTAGLNNPVHDMEPVVADNLVGIVIAAFQPIRTNHAVQIAAAGSP
jgi:signal peptidase I